MTSLQQRINTITGADVPLQLVPQSLFEELKTKATTYVAPRQFRSGLEHLISENFSICQGIAFLDDDGTGALAHQFPTQNPDYFLTGKRASKTERIEDPRSIFRDGKRVTANQVKERLYILLAPYCR